MNKGADIIFDTVKWTFRFFICTLFAFALSSFGEPSLQAQSNTSTEPLRQLNSSIEALIRKVSGSVVQILVTGYGAVEESDHARTDLIVGRERAIGSGFIIDSGGYILTNAHVLKGAQRVRVVLPTASASSNPVTPVSAQVAVVPARIVGMAEDIDLALIKVDNQNLPALLVAKYEDLVQGELVFAFGSPEGLRNTVTMGVVSATARQTDTDSQLVYIQTDAPINPGNSGGPLVNVNGEVVGVNTFILTQSGGNEGLGFAIPSNIVSITYNQIRKFGHVHRAQIGVSVQTITSSLSSALHLPQDSGLIISDVLPRSPAETAGLQVGDILQKVDGKPVDNIPYLSFHLMTLEAGDKIHLEVQRRTDHLTFDVPVAVPPHQVDQMALLANPDNSLVRPLGILGVEIDDSIAAQLPGLRDPHGILVVARSAEYTSEAPLTTGDVIRSVNGLGVATLDDLRTALKAIPVGAPIALQIQRNNGLLFLAFRLEEQ